jgi:hypothetical protein
MRNQAPGRTPPSKRQRAPLIALALALGALAGGCDLQLAPSVPTFAADIRPIMLSRCVRCHGAGGKLNSDPQQKGSIPGAPISGYFDALEDRGDCNPADGGPPGDSCMRGLGYYTVAPGLTTLKLYIHGSGNQRMPPPPSPALTDLQLETMDRWLAEQPPM